MKIINTGSVTTPIEGVDTLTVATQNIVNWDVDFRVLSQSADSVTFVNVNSPVDQPEYITLGVRERANIYSGVTVDASGQLANKRGVDVRVEVRQLIKVSDSEDPAVPTKYIPLRWAMTGTLPLGEPAFGNTETEDLISRTLAALAAQGQESILSGLNLLRHGVIER